MRTYLLAFLGTLATVLPGIGALNWAVDPYAIHRPGGGPGLAAAKPEVGERLRLVKAHQVERRRPAFVLLGSSRTDCGLDPDAKALAAYRGEVYNLGISGASAYEVRRYFEHAHAVRPLRGVAWGLDFFAFDRARPPQPDFDEARLAVAADGRPRGGVPDLARTLWSLDALASSARTLARPAGPTYTDAGFQPPAVQRARNDRSGGYLAVSRRLERELQDRRMDVVDAQGAVPALEHLRAVVRASHADGVDLRLFIPPSHARELEAQARGGRWGAFEAWKRALVRALDEEAERQGARRPFPLWDFSGYNGRTSESFLPPRDPETPLRWFYDSNHYTPAYGELILARVMGEGPAADDLGARLDARSVDAHLARLRAAQAAYRRRRPADLADVAAAAGLR